MTAREVAGAERKSLDQTGAHRFTHRRVLDRCSSFGFSATPCHSFPVLLHIGNVNAASQVSEESSIGTTRRFLASLIATTLPAMAAIRGRCVWYICRSDCVPVHDICLCV